MKILIFCALKDEALPIVGILRLKQLNKNSRRYEGRFFAHSIRLVISGLGRKNSLRACDECLKDPMPDLVFSCGYSGGLDQNLSVGAVVLSREIVILKKMNPPEKEARFYLESHWRTLQKYLDRLSSKLYRGTTVTVFHVVSKPEEKKRLACDSKAVSVDMEAGFIARQLMPKAIPFFNLRVISDTVNDELAIDFSPWVNKEGAVRRLPILGYLLRHPSKMKFFWKILRASQEGKKNLARAVKEIIEVLPLS